MAIEETSEKASDNIWVYTCLDPEYLLCSRLPSWHIASSMVLLHYCSMIGLILITESLQQGSYLCLWKYDGTRKLG
jgi:hypothetical protein